MSLSASSYGPHRFSRHELHFLNDAFQCSMIEQTVFGNENVKILEPIISSELKKIQVVSPQQIKTHLKNIAAYLTANKKKRVN